MIMIGVLFFLNLDEEDGVFHSEVPCVACYEHFTRIFSFFFMYFKNKYLLHGHNPGIKQNVHLLPRECNKLQVNVIKGTDVRAL